MIPIYPPKLCLRGGVGYKKQKTNKNTIKLFKHSQTHSQVTKFHQNILSIHLLHDYHITNFTSDIYTWVLHITYMLDTCNLLWHKIVPNQSCKPRCYHKVQSKCYEQKHQCKQNQQKISKMSNIVKKSWLD